MGDVLLLHQDVRCGLVLPGTSRDEVLAMAPRIEAAGFDSLWVGDHVSFHGPVTESLTLLSFAAAITERIQLGTSVYLLPLRHPVIAAKVAASLDMLSGGRLKLGVGVGGEFPPEFDAVGVPRNERGSRADESIGILRRLWSENDVAHRGRHFAFGPVSIDPKPARPGGPPILVGGRKAPSMRRAGRLGDGYISHMCAPEHYRRNLEVIESEAREAGRTSVPFETTCFLFTLPDDHCESAHRRAAEHLGRIYRTDFRAAARRYCLLGRPEDCLEQVERFAASGVRRFILAPLGPADELLDFAARELLPALGSLSSRLPTA